MKRQTLDAIYLGFNNVAAMSLIVLSASIVAYYSLNEMGVGKYNGLIRVLVPVSWIEFTFSIFIVNAIDYSERMDER